LIEMSGAEFMSSNLDVGNPLTVMEHTAVDATRTCRVLRLSAGLQRCGAPNLEVLLLDGACSVLTRLRPQTDEKLLHRIKQNRTIVIVTRLQR
jgi:hypothetical protein